MKKIGLFVPAWWPCTFFEEQQTIYADEYELYNLYGSCRWMPQKAQLKEILSFRNVFNLRSMQDGNCVAVDAQCPKYNSEKRYANAITIMSERLGELILRITNGQLPSFVYIQSRSDIAIFVAEWAKRNGIEIIIAEHVLYIRPDAKYLTRRRETIYQQADRVFCVSNYVYRNLVTSGFVMKNVKTIGNLVNDHGVPTDWIKMKKNGRVMFVAGHTADKDMETFFAVARQLEKQAIAVDVFGLTGDEEFEGKKLIDYASANVSFMGQMPHEDLLERYSHYSLLLSTSVSETFGLSVAEAIAHGTPVVCTDSGGIRDFVNERNGIVVPIRDVDAIVKAIDTSMHSKYDYASMSKEILDQYGKQKYYENCRR